jgi:hypothetical protein
VYVIGVLATRVQSSGAPPTPEQEKSLIYRRTKNLRVVQLLLGHTKLDYLPFLTMSRRVGMLLMVKSKGCAGGT